MRTLPILALLVLSACAAEPDLPSAEGTENPAATTPIEVPAEVFQNEADSTALAPSIIEDPAPDSTDA